jgi:putative phosphoesterase
MMPTTHVAVISDIHGNRWALEAILEDINRRGINKVVNLGDSVYGPLDPAGTARILLQMDLPTIRGNEDRLMVEAGSEHDDSPTLRYVRNSLAPDHIQWLKSLKPTAIAYDSFALCHGSPERDDEYLLEEVTESHVSVRTPTDLLAKVRSLEQPALLCGHSHLPRAVQLPNGKLVVNPGSVGLPAFTDDFPFPHAMQTGTPHARYSIVSGAQAQWRVENVAVPYDWDSAATTAQANGRPDWAEWLRTGRAAIT